MKKVLEWGTWVVGAAGILLMLLGVIARITGGVLLMHKWYNYFNTGIGFIILGIFLLLCILVCGNCKKE
jgi:phosphotransferase system  glucose/maltose/N-acetylglucosamine-specific IIC component